MFWVGYLSSTFSLLWIKIQSSRGWSTSSWIENNLFIYLPSFQRFEEKTNCVTAFDKKEEELKSVFFIYESSISLSFGAMFKLVVKGASYLNDDSLSIVKNYLLLYTLQLMNLLGTLCKLLQILYENLIW